MYDEIHYKPAQLAKLWGWRPDKDREWFRDEPGILIENRPEILHKRGCMSMRKPASVAARVYAEHLTNLTVLIDVETVATLAPPPSWVVSFSTVWRVASEDAYSNGRGNSDFSHTRFSE